MYGEPKLIYKSEKSMLNGTDISLNLKILRLAVIPEKILIADAGQNRCQISGHKG
jgi:hypothetical protein